MVDIPCMVINDEREMTGSCDVLKRMLKRESGPVAGTCDAMGESGSERWNGEQNTRTGWQGENYFETTSKLLRNVYIHASMMSAVGIVLRRERGLCA